MPLNVEELLAEIPGDNPAGESLPYSVRTDLEDARKSVDPNDYDENDPARPEEAKPANWPKIVSLASRTLAETSKDLQVGARLTEAVTKTEGFAGLADGLALLRGMVERCWDRLYPVIEDGDVEVRAGPFDWLGDGDRGARFPNTVAATAIVAANGKAYSSTDWKLAQLGKGPGKEALDRAVASAPREQCQATFDALTKCQQELMALGQLLGDKMGPVAPAMTDLRAALGECYTLAKQILQQKGPGESGATGGGELVGGEPAAGGEAGGGSAALDGQATASRAIATRADVYRRLHESADLLERLEPHSPIPYLIRRAIELGGLPFPLLMKALIRDEGVLTEMNRELGIKGDSPPPADE